MYRREISIKCMNMEKIHVYNPSLGALRGRLGGLGVQRFAIGTSALPEVVRALIQRLVVTPIIEACNTIVTTNPIADP